MKEGNPKNNGNVSAKEELDALSPLLASLPKRTVPPPPASYFDALASDVLETALTKPKTKVLQLWHAAAGIAVAASVALAVFFWPAAPTLPIQTETIAFDSFSDEQLLEMTLMDDAMVSGRLLEEDSLVYYLASNQAFQYLEPENSDNENYNRLLLEMIDNEMLMEEWL